MYMYMCVHCKVYSMVKVTASVQALPASDCRVRILIKLSHCNINVHTCSLLAKKCMAVG